MHDGTRSGQADADRSDFAANVGITFHTPEEFFFGQAPRPFERTLDPSDYIDSPRADAGVGDDNRNGTSDGANEAEPAFSRVNAVDVVLLCGLPASGKSTYYETYLQPLGYERINQDILKSVGCPPMFRQIEFPHV